MGNTNLIGISGRAGSGKDTVGAIIQYLTAEDTGRFCLGRIESGKSIDGHHNSTFEVKKFAGKLKTIASLLSGANIEDFEDQEFKKGKMTADWDYELVGEDWVDGQPQKRPMTYREFLQKLGTEAMRDGLHTNVWVNALFADYKGFVKEWDEFGNDLLVEYPNWIITDMRFPNEMEAIEERGGITIRVVREHDIKVQRSGNSDDYVIEKFDKTNSKHVALKLAESSRLHPSETALDDAEFHYTIENDGTLEELIEKVKRLLFVEGIL